MSKLKKWAKLYYPLSPIFQDKLFSQPGNESLVCINPRLFAAYCIKMNKEAHYSKETIQLLIKQKFKQHNYWIQYIQRLLKLPLDKQKEQIENQTSAQEQLIRQHFDELLSQLFHRKIKQSQFTNLCANIQYLLLKESMTQIDFYVLDLSLYSFDQIFEISSIKLQTALKCIGPHSLKFIQEQAKRQINPNSFQLINLLNRIKDSVNLSPQLLNLYLMLQGKQNIKQLLIPHQKNTYSLKKQALGFMLWLLHVNQLGEFVYKFVRQNYLFSRYCKDSVQITCNILQAITFDQNLQLQELIVFNEIVFKLQDIQEQCQFFEHVRHNVEIELKLKLLKQKISNYLNNFNEKNMDNGWISQLDKYQIDFQSSLSVNIVKKLINQLYEQKHFSIILEKENYGQLLSLCLKINQKQLYQKIKLKLKINLQRKNGLLLVLQNNRLNQVINQANFSIYSVYELKRIKKMFLKLSVKGQQSLYKLFTNDDILLLRQLKAKLSKDHKDLQKHQIDYCLEKMFITFKL